MGGRLVFIAVFLGAANELAQVLNINAWAIGYKGLAKLFVFVNAQIAIALYLVVSNRGSK